MNGVAWKQGKVVEVLEPYLKLGYTYTKACKIAGIPHNTVSGWLENDNELRLKFESWQNELNVQARRIIVKKIEAGNADAARWWLERREKEDFSQRSEITGAEGEPIVKIDAGEDPYKTPEGKKLLLLPTKTKKPKKK